ncbi:hypothetical protein N0V88_007822 [Collariella sp. IMI 366227]|nr:hypothetical protein N0V88_007822 [Collariella sp. IMI 366227]
MSALPDNQPKWAAHRMKIKDLYWDHNMTLPDVMKIMKEIYGFVATKKMYKKNIKAWGLEKNHKTAESLAMISIKERRRLAHKRTIFFRRGKLVESAKLHRFSKRHKLMAHGGDLPSSDQQGTSSLSRDPLIKALTPAVATPPDITYGTPESDRSGDTPQPTFPPPFDPDMSEGDQGVMDDSESQGFESDESFLSNHAFHSLASGLNRTVPPFGIQYNPDFGYATLAVPNVPDHPGPHTVSCVLDHGPLHTAVINRDFQAAKALLMDGTNPNCCARGGMTPLHYAAYQRDPELVRLLMDHGANLDAMTDQNRSVLFFAVRGQRHMANNDMLAYHNQNRTTADFPTDDGTLRILDTLFDGPSGWIRLRRSFDKIDRAGTTPLMVAAGEGYERTVEMFLMRTAQPDAKDHAGHTALKYAAMGNHRKIVRLLLETDEGVFDGKVAHLLKLASKNFTTAAAARNSGSAQGQGQGHARGGGHVHEHEHGHGGGSASSWWDDSNSSALIAEEMVTLCREMGLLKDLLELAGQKQKTGVLQRLGAAQGRTDI